MCLSTKGDEIDCDEERRREVSVRMMNHHASSMMFPTYPVDVNGGGGEVEHHLADEVRHEGLVLVVNAQNSFHFARSRNVVFLAMRVGVVGVGAVEEAPR